MNESSTFDPIWEDLRQKGQNLSRYPYDLVVSFVYRNMPRDKKRGDIKILEVGCGGGNNLWFAAKEGFQVTGIDASPTAIDYARKRFEEESLKGDFRIGDFTDLPFEDNSFDMVIDRGSIICCGKTAGRQAIKEIWRVLLPGGRFIFNPYSAKHTSYTSGEPGPDGLTVNIKDGTLTGVGQISFYGREDVKAALSNGWKILSFEHMEIIDEADEKHSVHAEWRVIAEKLS